MGANLRLKLRCFQTEKRQVVLYETVALISARKRGMKAWISDHDSGIHHTSSLHFRVRGDRFQALCLHKLNKYVAWLLNSTKSKRYS